MARFIELPWKNGDGAVTSIAIDSIESFRVPRDGQGCSIIFRDGRSMTTSMSYEAVKRLISDAGVD